MSDPRNVQHDKKVIHEKQAHGEDLTKGAAHVPQPGKKTPKAEEKPSQPPEHPTDFPVESSGETDAKK